jgi:quinolinate synthase
MHRALKNMRPEIVMDEALRESAQVPLDRMLLLGA